MTLKNKAILTVFSLIFLALAANTLVLNTVTGRRYREALLGRAEAVGQSLHRDIERALLLGLDLEHIPGLNEKLRELADSAGDITYAAVTRSDGTILFHSDAQQIGQQRDATPRVSAQGHTIIREVGDHYEIVLLIESGKGRQNGALRIGLARSAVTAELTALALWSLGTAAVILALALSLVYLLISRMVTKPILAAKEAAERIAGGDLSSRLHAEGRDEIAALGRAMNTTALHLRELLAGIRNMTEGVARAGRGITDAAASVRNIAGAQGSSLRETAESFKDMDADIANIAASVDKLARSAVETSTSMAAVSEALESVAGAADVSDERASETAVSMEEMVRNIDAIADSVARLSETFEQITVSATELDTQVGEISERARESVALAEQAERNASERGRSAVEAARNGMAAVRETVESMTGVVRGLGNRSEDIGKILEVIASVTEQTNLLSLNAAILASQAGEHGKAFSVVATEIGSLAEKTAASTTNIEEIVKAVQDDIAASVDMAERGTGFVGEAVSQVGDVAAAFEDIAKSSRHATDMARAIQAATAEQATGVRIIRESIQEVRESQIEQISRATEEQGQGSRMIVDATETLKEMIGQIRTGSSTQRSSSRQIADALSKISAEIEQIAAATAGLKDRSRDVVSHTDVVLKTTEDLLSAADAMGGTVSNLDGETRSLQSAIGQIELDGTPAEG